MRLQRGVMFYTDTELLAAPVELWPAIRAQATPLYDRDRHRATFVFTAPPEAQGVQLWINRLTDKQMFDAGVMRRIAGTDLWVRTVDIPPGYLGSYCFRIGAGGDNRPNHNDYPFACDPTNPDRLITDGSCGVSLVRGAGREIASPWVDLNDSRAAAVTKTQVDSYPVRWYLPAKSQQNLPVLVLFDADVWFDRIGLNAALEEAIAAGMMPPVAVAGVGFTDTAQRRATLTPHHDTHAFLQQRVLPAFARHAADHGYGLSDEVLLAGQSLGGLQAVHLGFTHPEHYSGLSACSPSLWWHPGADASPADLSRHNVAWLAKGVAATKPPGKWPPCLLHVGSLEGMLVAHTFGLSHAMEYAGWQHRLRVHNGGHDYAWWREALIGDLVELLHPRGGGNREQVA